MTTPSQNDGSSDVDTPSNTPKYSPVTLSSIHAAIGELGYSKEYIPVVSQALDELQLALSTAQGGTFLSVELANKAKSSKYLHIDTHSEPKKGPTQLSRTTLLDSMKSCSRAAVSSGRYSMSFSASSILHGSTRSLRNRSRLGAELGSGMPGGLSADSPSTDAFAEDRLIPGVTSLEMLYAVHDIVELAFYIYITEPGFDGSLTTDLEPDVPRLAELRR
ncbi:hypothetical protein ACFQH8_21395 [Halomicroarcula sp. GCM10025710]